MISPFLSSPPFPLPQVKELPPTPCHCFGSNPFFSSFRFSLSFSLLPPLSLSLSHPLRIFSPHSHLPLFPTFSSSSISLPHSISEIQKLALFLSHNPPPL